VLERGVNPTAGKACRTKSSIEGTTREKVPREGLGRGNVGDREVFQTFVGKVGVKRNGRCNKKPEKRKLGGRTPGWLDVRIGE